MLEHIRQNAELVQSVARDQLDVEVDFDRAGVEWLDAYLTGQHEHGNPDNFKGLISTLGSFFGECIVHTFGGKWTPKNNGWYICFDEKNAVYPFAKVEKHLHNGPEDSVLSLFDAIPVFFKEIIGR
ncbi:MAG: hypothetical protein AAFW75_31370 [Cyanobacteria bacterium J06636_16]